MIKLPHFCIPPFPFNVLKFYITLNPPSDLPQKKWARLSLLFLEALNNNDSLFKKWSHFISKLSLSFPQLSINYISLGLRAYINWYFCNCFSRTFLSDVKIIQFLIKYFTALAWKRSIFLWKHIFIPSMSQVCSTLLSSLFSYSCIHFSVTFNCAVSWGCFNLDVFSGNLFVWNPHWPFPLGDILLLFSFVNESKDPDM